MYEFETFTNELEKDRGIDHRLFLKYATALLLTGCAGMQSMQPSPREFEPRILVEDFD